MSQIWFLAKNILRLTFRKKSSFFIFFVLPLMGLLVSIAMYTNLGSEPLRLGVVDLDNSWISKELSQNIGEREAFEISYIESLSINELLLENQVSSVIVYPKGWSEGLFTSSPVQLEIISLRGAETTAWLESYIDMYLENLYTLASASEGDRELFDQLYSGYKGQELKLKSERVEDQLTGKMMTVQGLGFLLMFMMLGTTKSSESILREKRGRTYFRICASPTKPWKYVAGNLLANLVIVFFQLIAVIVLIEWVFRVDTHISRYQLFTILFSYGLVAIAFGLLIAAFSKTSYQASTMATLIITPSCMLAGCYWSVSYMPDFMQTLSYFMPQRWALLAIESLQAGAAFSQVLINILVLIAFALALFTVSAYKFKTSDDLTSFV